ncbi:mechanosensitive ion channel domain-containing protein [Methanolobus sp. ZRKC3]|uniref:mechanosensitive ion channel family protein n=1 Tax=Methanolobus sp. ZRKC3 TaxID=3125786 RepID=UPI0032533273
MPIKNLLSKKASDKTLEKVKLKTKSFGKALNRLILLFLFVIFPMVAVIIADNYGMIEVPLIVKSFLNTVVTILVSYTLATIFLKLTINLVSSSFEGTGKPEEKILLSKIYVAFIYSLATVVIFWQLGTDIQNIFLSIGLIATGFAFAIRDVILSYFIWFILLTKKPFKIGDYIRVGDEEGLVKHIGLFYVVVDPYPRTYDDFFKIPNKVFLEKPINNYGKGRFFSQFDLYVKEVPEDILQRIETIREKGRNITGADAVFTLNSDCDGLKINVLYRTKYNERELIRDHLLSLMIQEIGTQHLKG